MRQIFGSVEIQGQVNYTWQLWLPDINGLNKQKMPADKGGKKMPRTSRMIISDQKAVYHVMSRTALDGFPLKDVEKDFILAFVQLKPFFNP